MAFGEFAKKMAGKIGEKISTGWKNLKTWGRETANKIGNTFNKAGKVLDQINDFGQNVADFTRNNLPGVSGTIDKFIPGGGKVIDKIGQQIVEGSEHLNNFNNNFHRVNNTVQEIASKIPYESSTATQKWTKLA